LFQFKRAAINDASTVQYCLPMAFSVHISIVGIAPVCMIVFDFAFYFSASLLEINVFISYFVHTDI